MTDEEIPDAELDVMSCLWARGEQTAREIREALYRRRPMTHGSVCTLLRRLEEKGYVSRARLGTGKAFSYRAILEPKRPAKSVLNNVVDRLFGGSGVALVASLLESRPITPQEIETLESMLADLKSRKAKKNKERK